MKLEQNDKSLIFSLTQIPDIFFSEHLPTLSGNALKLYLYITFLSKYKKDIKLADLSKKLDLPLSDIQDLMTTLENFNLILKKSSGYIVVDLQELALNSLYSPNLSLSAEKIQQNTKNDSRSKAVTHINNAYFQGIMSPLWYNDIDLWFTKFKFDEQVMIALFDYCYNKKALHRNYVQTVAEAWANNQVHTWNDLETYYDRQDKLTQLKKNIAKKLGKRSGLTAYEEAYIENWTNTFNYSFDIIEIALKRTTLKSNFNFEYLNTIITSWHENDLKTVDQINSFVDQKTKQEKDIKSLQKQVAKTGYDQRNYDNLDHLYINTSFDLT